MKPIIQTYEMKATPKEVFTALVTPGIIQKWSGAPAQMDGNVGTKFVLFGGAIHGTNLEVVPDQKLVQEWYAGNWETPSTVTFTLRPTQAGTAVELRHEDVPDNAHGDISAGWDTNYLGSMQKMFGAGTR
jgi:activator of HSP90 ATPase